MLHPFSKAKLQRKWKKQLKKNQTMQRYQIGDEELNE